MTAWIGLVYLRRIYLSPSDGIAIQEKTVEFPVLCLRKVRLRERCGGRHLETQDVPLGTLRAVAQEKKVLTNCVPEISDGKFCSLLDIRDEITHHNQTQETGAHEYVLWLRLIFMTSIMSRLFGFWDSLAGVLWPRFFLEGFVNEKSPSSQGQLETLTVAAKKALLGNASYLFEPNFRRRVLTSLCSWASEDISYSAAKSDLEVAFTKRGRLIAFLTPGHGISQTLMAFGFFSTSRRAFNGPISNVELGLQSRIAELGLFLRNPKKMALELFRDIRKSRNGIISPFLPLTREYFAKPQASSEFEVWKSSATCLVIGPSQIKAFPDYQQFNSVLIMVTLNNSLTLLKKQIFETNAAVVLNGEAASEAVRGVQTSEWISVLKTARYIYCHRYFVQEIGRLTEVPTYARESNLMNLWGNVGAPNLLPITVGLLAKEGLVAHVIGANLYVSSQVYDQGPSVNPSEDDSRQHFQTCVAVSGHNPVIAFAIMKKLMMSGNVQGDDDLKNILGLQLIEYLEALDRSLGFGRR